MASSAQAEDLLVASADDVAVNEATMKAQQTLPLFWAKFDAAPPGYDSFAVKVGLQADGGGVEHIWIDEIGRANGKVRGLLANEPFDLAALAMGSEVEVDEARISDWQYARDGKVYGHFTTRVLMERAGRKQRAQARKMFAPTPLEPEAD